LLLLIAQTSIFFVFSHGILWFYKNKQISISSFSESTICMMLLRKCVKVHHEMRDWLWIEMTDNNG